MTLVGLILIITGTLLMAGFQPDPQDELGRIEERTTGTSKIARFWNDVLMPKVFRVDFPTRAIPLGEQRVITTGGEAMLARIGFWLIVLGCLLQLIDLTSRSQCLAFHEPELRTVSGDYMPNLHFGS